MIPPGPNAADASLHLHPGGVFGGAVGCHVHPGVAGFPLRPHPHRPRQDVPAAAHLHHQRDGLCKLTTGGRNKHHYLLSHTCECRKRSEVDKQFDANPSSPSWTQTTQNRTLTSATVTMSTRRCTCLCNTQHAVCFPLSSS